MNEMLIFFKNLKGNPKLILMIDPLFTVPFNMFTPFATLYMFALGLSDFEIGILISISMFANFIMALLGGIVVDKFGRRKSLLLGDFLAWNIPVLLWAFSQNFWWFLAATLFNSIQHIATVSFECNWLDDIEEHKMQKLVNLFFFLFYGSILFALVSGYFVLQYSVVPVLRVVYLFAFASMGTRLLILFFRLKETKRGQERLVATKGKSILFLLSGYKDVFFLLTRSRDMLKVLILMPMVSIFTVISNTFFALYTTQNLGLGEYFIAYFPVIRAVVVLLFFAFIQSRLDRYNRLNLMCIGLLLYVLGHTLLLLSPPENI